MARRALTSKIFLVLVLWYETSAELGLSGGASFAVMLLICSGLVMALRLPGQVLSLLGPRAITLIGPVAIWFGMAAWLMPRAVWSYPVASFSLAALFVLGGAALRYVLTRHPQKFPIQRPQLQAALVPAVGLILGVAQEMPGGLLSTGVIVALVGLPVHMGWRLIGEVPPPRFDARMGDAEGFHDAGYREER